MIFINLIVTIIIIVALVSNLKSMSASLKQKQCFMQYKLEDNEFIYKSAIRYKMQILKLNRVYFLFAVLFALVLIPFNKSWLILYSYFIIFFVGAHFINLYFINKYANNLKEMNIFANEQDGNFKKWGILYDDAIDNKLFKPYSIKRFAININHKYAKTLIGGIIAVLVIVLALSVMHDFKLGFFNNQPKVTTQIEEKDAVESSTQPINRDLKYDITKSNVVLKYKDKEYKIKKSDIAKITKLEELPNITRNVDGNQDAGVNIGRFDLQTIGASTLILDKNHKPFIQITLKDKSNYFINYTDDDFFAKLNKILK